MEESQPEAARPGEEASCSSWRTSRANTNFSGMPTESVEIDDALYSRQRYVLGDTAMQKMAKSHVFLSGMGGLGLEIAKNLVLAGIKALTIHDTEKCQAWDLGTNFFLCEDDVVNIRNRAEAVLQHIAELNPYVHVTSSSIPLNETTDLSFLDKYQCVVLTEMKLSLQKKINDFCRSQCPPIKFISADVHGIWSRLFCDFGDEFEVLDTTGEEPKEIFISDITQANPGIVTCLENRPHKLETGQFLTFREINGMTGLNGSTQQITVVSPFSFSIGDTTELEPYLHGGIAIQVKTSKTFCFESLEMQLKHPKYLTVDFSKPEAPLEIHSAMLALDQFQENYSRKPNIGCQQDSEELLKLATSISETLEEKPEVNYDIVRWLSWTAQGFLPPLAAAVGGVASQEVLKAVTGKFSPLCQWLYIEAADLVESLSKPEREEFLPRGDRYDALRACIGDTLCQKLQNLNIFLVGCGAIGCEMLKNFALLGVGTGKEKGMVTVTDPDLIEKSNLNRQFLFRPHHIQKPKSYTAADAILKINPQLKIDAHLNKVCSATEAIYNDEFYTKQDIIITALDNVEARKYVDSRCLANLRPLLDSGTMGTKGHTEVIVPHLTESYNSHRDPPEEEIPFCTLKSFPAAIEHTIQWARDKFESSFSYKPSLFNKFWQTYPSAEEVLQKIQTGHSLEGCFQVIKLLSRRPRNWSQCVELARLKFEKYFNHKALQLLHCFPLDTRLKDGSLFWQSPKRPPSPLKFDLNEPLHFSFLLNAAKLYATIYCIPFTEEDLSADILLNILSEVKIQEFKPSDKVVQTDETARKPDHVPVSSEDERNAIFQLEKAISSNEATTSDLQMAVLSFEKDDDHNGHIDFITAASNLRAKMYSIEPADRLKTKRIAGRIIPAIATSTAAVSGLVALEMIKVAGDYPFEAYKNCFLNLAIPIIVFTETSEVRKTEIRNGISFTIWDRWTIHGKEDFTLLDFINAVKEKYGIEPTMVVQGVKMLYVPVMPGHAKRLKLTMHKLVKPSAEKKYVDLTVSFAPDADGDEDLPGPPDHLKNDYRRRFCRPSRAPDINTEQGQNILEVLLDCFEEKSLASDVSKNATKSVLYSTPKTKDICVQSSSKETQSPKSHPKSGPVSSRKKEAPLQLTVELNEAVNKSVQEHEVHQKILATDVHSKNTSDLRKMSSKKLKDNHSEADEDCYLSVGSPSDLDIKASSLQKGSPSVAQKRETHASKNSVNMLSSSTEISHKTRKRLSFEDKDVLKKVEITNEVSEIEDKVSEGLQDRKQSRTSQKRIQDSEYENQPQARKSFSTLFLETVKRKSESSSVVRHIATVPPHLSPANNTKLLEDEFIIDESDKSFVSQPWITIPRKTGPLKQHTASPAESTVLQRKKSRERHDSISSVALTSNKHPGKAHPIEKSQPSEPKIPGESCALSDDVENNCKSTKYEIYSENAKKSGDKRTIKQKQRTKSEANVPEEEVNVRQSKDKNINISHTVQDKLQRNSDKNMEEDEEISVSISKNQLLSVGSKKGSTNVPHKKNQKKDKECKKKHFSSGSKNNKIEPEELTSTIRRSQRISRCPSDWWVVKSEQSSFSSSSSVRNELSVYHNSRQKPPAEKTNQSSKNIGKKAAPFKKQKRANKGSSGAQVLYAKDSGGSQNEPLGSNEADLAKKKNPNPPGDTGSSKNQDSMAAQNVHQKSQMSVYTCTTPTKSNLDSGEPGTSVLEGSGPFRLKNYLTSGKNSSDVDDNVVQENLNDSRGEISDSTSESKMHHKLVLPSCTPNVRRTMRTRSKPLEYWRGERIDYQARPSGGFVIGGILSPDTVSSKRKAKGNLGRIITTANRKRICLENEERKNKFVVNLNIPLGDPLQPTRVKDPETQETVLMDLIRPRDTYQFCVEHDELKVYKTLDTPFFSSGKLIIGPLQEKGKQHVGLDTLVFYVNLGYLLCTLHETPYIVTTGDSFYVPSGNYYNIKNLLNEESVLLFTQIKS